jgi:hypothetical protein
MLVDTHCHLDAAEFDADRDSVAKRRPLAVGRSGISWCRPWSARISAPWLRCAGTTPAAPPPTAFIRCMSIAPASRTSMPCAKPFNANSRWRWAKSVSIASSNRATMPARSSGSAPSLKLRAMPICRSCCMCDGPSTRCSSIFAVARARRHRPCLQRQPPAGRRIHQAGLQAGFRRRHELSPAPIAHPRAGGNPAARCHRAGNGCAGHPAGVAGRSGRNSPDQLPRDRLAMAELRGLAVEELAAASPRPMPTRCFPASLGYTEISRFTPPPTTTPERSDT